MRKHLTLPLLILLLTFLSGCSLMGPVKTADIHTYTLSGFRYNLPRAHGKKITLMLSTPTASVGYQSHKMMYNKKSYELSAFAHNQWAGPPADMLQPLITQYIRSTGYFHAVVTAPISADSNIRLKVNLLELRQDFTHSPSVVCMAIQSELINVRTNKVIDSRRFGARIPTYADTPYAGVHAANLATHRLLIQLAQFCARNIAHPRRVSQKKTVLKRKLAKVNLPKPKQLVALPLPVSVIGPRQYYKMTSLDPGPSKHNLLASS